MSKDYRKPYSLWKRSLGPGRHVFYARFRLDDGSWGTAKSTGQTRKSAAEGWAVDYLKSGQVVIRENITLQMFAAGFFESGSEFLRSRALRGRQAGNRHLANQRAHLENHLIPVFGQSKLSRIDSAAIEQFTQDLYEGPLTPTTINHILRTLKTVLDFAYKKKYLQHPPLVEMVPAKHVEKGILNMKEVKDFFGREWPDHRHLAINLLAATCGLRMGEIRGLLRQTVHFDHVVVETSWEKGYGLKGTKTGRPRIVPLSERCSAALQEVMRFSAYVDPTDLVFYGRRREVPLDPHIISNAYYTRLSAIGIDKTARQTRHITFHSWRHFFNALLINARVPLPKVQSLTGHVTERMTTETYYHADDYADVIETVGRIG